MSRTPGVARALYAGKMSPSPGVSDSEELARLKRQSKNTERIWARFRQIEIRMIGAQSLREVVGVLVDEFTQAFSHVDCVTLACVDPEYQLSRLVQSGAIGTRALDDDETQRVDIAQAFVRLEKPALDRLFAGLPRPRLIACDRALQSLLFPNYAPALGSVALAPLVLRGELIGTLNQGSRDPAHFTPDAATDLLDHLAAVAAMCVDNAVNHERLRSFGLTDGLTGVANRRFFERRLEEEIERWFRRQEPLACMLVDIDHFKRVNDNYGHQVGDIVLREAAGLLGQDRRGADVLARYGGEEFVVLLPNTPGTQTAAIAQRLRERIAQHRFAIGPGESCEITASIGVSVLDRDSEWADQLPGQWLLQRADQALYQAKHAGRNRVVVAGEVASQLRKKK